MRVTRMERKNRQVQIDLSKLKTLRRAVIDSSTLIYLSKLELLEYVTKEVDLIIPSAVFREIGSSGIEGVQVVPPVEAQMKADAQVVALARRLGCAVCSDDKKILLNARKQGADYFNTLMLILLLKVRKRLTTDETEKKLLQLKRLARYNAKIWKYGEDLFAWICKNE